MKIAIYGQHYDSENKKYLRELISILDKFAVEYQIEADFHTGMSSDFNLSDIPTFRSYHDLDHTFDFMFTVGGDGTILRAVTFVRDLEIPLVGINTGRLGFLATIQKEEIARAVERVFQQKFNIYERSLLSVTTEPETEGLKTLNFALNEVSVSRKNTPSMITVKTYLDGEYLTSYWADGLIIATPTGSTGYSLSCGGPIITPSAKSFALTPIAPHNLNARPLVVPDDTTMLLEVAGREDAFFLSLDSRITTVSSATKVKVQKADFKLKMVQVGSRTFLKTLREKLLWGLDTRN